MSRRSGNASKTRGAAASSRDTGLTLFDMTTCEPLATPLRASTSSAAASPAKTCRSQGKALASQARAVVCGSSSRASLANFDPASSSWRTSQRSCLVGWTPFSGSFPSRGMMRSGSISALPTLERRTDESGCSSSPMTWGTPRAHIGAGDPAKRAARGMIEGQVALADRSACGDLSPSWVEQLMGFPAGWTSPPTDGPSAPAKRSTKTSRRASRKTDESDSND